MHSVNSKKFETSGMQLEMAGATDVGLVRSRNEDYIKLLPEYGAAILSDGMGGHLAGDIASRMAVEIIAEALIARGNATISTAAYSGDDLVASLQKANKSIRTSARNRPECHGMGATVVLFVFTGQACIAHLGDSRAYLFANDKLTQLTEDHTLAQQYLNEGMIDAIEARTWAGRNLLIKALGITPRIDPDVTAHDIERDNIYLLCSDGLTEVVADDVIEQTLRSASDALQVAAQRLIALARKRGGPDNISVILVRVLSDGSDHG